MKQNWAPEPRAAERGFTLVELVVSLLVAVEILIAGAIVFDVHNRMAVIQTQITDMQQSLRISHYEMVRMLRMAGRGGLGAVFTADPGPPVRLVGTVIDVRNNVEEADDTNQVAVGTDQPRARPGTDILTVRGCITTSLYQIAGNGIDFNMIDATTAQVTLSNPSPLGIPQCLAPLAEQLPDNGGSGLSGPVVIGSSRDRSTFHVATDMQFASSNGDPLDCSDDAAPSTMTLTISFSANTFSPNAFDPAMGPALICQLEEYRYYVRDIESDIGANTFQQPRLSRARMQPGTESPFANDATNLQLDIADGIFDLQAALGFDSDYPSASPANPGTPGSFGDDLDNLGDDDLVFEGEDADEMAADDWLFNTPDDDPTALEWRAHQNPVNSTNPVDLLYVRLTLAARTAKPDPQYVATDMDGIDGDGVDFIEDNDYTQAPSLEMKEGLNRNYRRRVLATVVDLRNLG